MYIVLLLLLVVIIQTQAHNFANFSVECKDYIRYLNNIIFKIENVKGDLLSHQIKFKKVKKEIKEKSGKSGKSGWF